jgi:predicted RNA binding protein YcfA (HicA-like mRNA interferase family)
VSPVPGFPSMGTKQMKRLLKRELGYEEVPNRGKGSHTRLEAPGRPPINWGYHDSKRELAPIEVRNLLVSQAGLTLEEARKVVQRA